MSKTILTIDFNIFLNRYFDLIENKVIEFNSTFNKDLYLKIFNKNFLNVLKHTKDVYFLDNQKDIVKLVKYNDIVYNIDYFDDSNDNNLSFLITNRNWAAYLIKYKHILYNWINVQEKTWDINSIFNINIETIKADTIVICNNEYLHNSEYETLFFELRDRFQNKNSNPNIITHLFSKNKNTENCITTLLSSDYYLYGVLGLYYSVRKFSKNDFVVICTNNISDNILNKLDYYNIEYIKVNDLSDNIHHWADITTNINMMTVVNKIYSASLTNYKKVLFIDADCILCRDIDKIFTINNNKNFYGTITKFKDKKIYLSNIFLITPSEQTFNDLKKNLLSLKFSWKDVPPDGNCFEKTFGINLLEIPHDVIIYHNSYRPKYWNNIKNDRDLFIKVQKMIALFNEFTLCQSKELGGTIQW